MTHSDHTDAEVLRIDGRLSVPLAEIHFDAIRAQGAGGQHVNKTASAVQLRFDVLASSLPSAVKEKLLQLRDQRISREGVVVIKAQTHRRQELNRDEALTRLCALLQRATARQAPRIATRPTRSSQRKRLDGKTHRGTVKALRQRPQD